ncbi:MAG TPA: recombinase family protein [Chloroflexota bacterium]|nr:recombinase family protein [Chloroflexota bacterium]
MDTTTPQGELVFGMMANLAQFESTLIGERVKAGMARAKAQGKRTSRPHDRRAACRGHVDQADRQGTRDRLRHGVELRQADPCPRRGLRPSAIPRNASRRALSEKAVSRGTCGRLTGTP